MTLVLAVPLVSVVWCCCDHSVYNVLLGALATVVSAMPLVSLVPIGVSVSCFGDHSVCSASGIIGVCLYFCELLWSSEIL